MVCTKNKKPVRVKSKFQIEINWTDETAQFGEKLYQSLEYLNFKRQNANAANACETIRRFLSESEKFRLYREFFPDEWGESSASFFKPGYFHHHSERANEFFQLVDANLFPVASDWADDPENNLDGIVVYGMNFDLCCEDIEWENLRPAYLAGLLFYLWDDAHWRFICETYNLQENIFPKINRAPHENLWKQEKTDRNKLYIRLFEIIDHSTGNVWIDTVNCQGVEWFEWTAENVRMLAKQFAEAKEMLDSLDVIDEEMRLRPAQTLKKLISLWNTGKLPGEKSPKEKTSGEQAAGKLLIDILV